MCIHFFSLINDKLTKMLQYTTCLNFYGFKLCFHTMCIFLQLVHHIFNLKVSFFTPTKKILAKNHIMLEHHNIVTILIIMFESLGISKWRLTSKTKEMICNSLKANKKWTWKRKNSQILKMMTYRCGVNEECKKYKVHMVIQRIGALENWG